MKNCKYYPNSPIAAALNYVAGSDERQHFCRPLVTGMEQIQFHVNMVTSIHVHNNNNNNNSCERGNKPSGSIKYGEFYLLRIC